MKFAASRLDPVNPVGSAWISQAAKDGTAYDLSPYFRISTAASEDTLTKAMDRIKAAIAKLTKA